MGMNFEPASEPELPAFPADGTCKCGCVEWYDVEEGYTRMSGATFQEDGVLRVFQDGWDDMSEGGDKQYVACQACGAHYESPEQVEYDG